MSSVSPININPTEEVTMSTATQIKFLTPRASRNWSFSARDYAWHMRQDSDICIKPVRHGDPWNYNIFWRGHYVGLDGGDLHEMMLAAQAWRNDLDWFNESVNEIINAG